MQASPDTSYNEMEVPTPRHNIIKITRLEIGTTVYYYVSLNTFSEETTAMMLSYLRSAYSQ